MLAFDSRVWPLLVVVAAGEIEVGGIRDDIRPILASDSKFRINELSPLPGGPHSIHDRVHVRRRRRFIN